MFAIINNKHTNFKSNYLHPVDIKYKQSLQLELKKSYGINCKLSDLASIAGPIETRSIINLLKSQNYKVGKNFRANFHIHTNASDGRLTPQEFLNACADWANNVFKRKKDKLPPFSAAITDHDSVKSTKEAIVLISQNPDKYKNFKFISGCEFLFNGYKEPNSSFEAVALGFNPFATEIQPLTKGMGNVKNHVSDIPKIVDSGGVLSWAHPIYSPDKINDDFFVFLKQNGINGIEGNYQYNTADSEYVESVKKELTPFIKKYNMFLTGGTDSHKKSIF